MDRSLVQGNYINQQLFLDTEFMYRVQKAYFIFNYMKRFWQQNTINL